MTDSARFDRFGQICGAGMRRSQSEPRKLHTIAEETPRGHTPKAQSVPRNLHSILPQNAPPTQERHRQQLRDDVVIQAWPSASKQMQVHLAASHGELTISFSQPLSPAQKRAHRFTLCTLRLKHLVIGYYQQDQRRFLMAINIRGGLEYSVFCQPTRRPRDMWLLFLHTQGASVRRMAGTCNFPRDDRWFTLYAMDTRSAPSATSHDRGIRTRVLQAADLRRGVPAAECGEAGASEAPPSPRRRTST